LPAADLVLVDEAHHATAKSWRRILDCFPVAALVGLTATPVRRSGTGLGDVFQALVEAPQVAELIADGYLVGTRVFGPAVGPDLRGVHTRGGDYVESEVAARVDQPLLVGDVVTHWLWHAAGRRTIVYAASVAHSLHLAAAFRAAGIVAEHLDGTTPAEERDRILQRMADGVVDVVCNCAVLAEGFDCPAVGCIVIARPTRAFGLYKQMIGRGLRPAEGKLHCIVLDHAGATEMHGFAEEPVVWSLDTRQRAQSAAKATAQGGTGQRELVACPECGAFHWRGRACAACGWRPRPKSEPVDVVDEDLVELKRNGRRIRNDLDQRGFHRELIALAAERGYRPGWAAFKFKEKFGKWPPRGWRADSPTEPHPATRSWVRSRMIAYAKGKAKARAEA
jgi:superfamily II DNA or RNA helicase